MNELESKIYGTFKRFQPRKFRQLNGIHTDTILATISALVDRYPYFPWKNYGLMTEDDMVGGAFCSTTNNLFFYTSCYENSLTAKDITFLAAHEVGHMFDFRSGRISYNVNEPNFFTVNTGEKVSVQFVEDLLKAYLETRNWNKRKVFARAYASTNAEYAANVFAAREVERPDDLGFQIFYDVGAGKLAKLEIDA